MDFHNALGLTLRSDRTAVDVASAVDWDSITIVSLQSIPEIGRKFLFFHSKLTAVGRWSAGVPKVISPSSWRRTGVHWRTRFSASIRKFRRRLPALLHAMATNMSSDRGGIAFRPLNAIPHPVYYVPASTYECAACQCRIGLMQEDAILVPCGHQYHVDCILALVETCTQTLSSFPPKCCRQTIPTAIFERYMSPAQRTAFFERQAEHDTPKRVYCADPHCSRFLGARDKRLPVRVFTCPTRSCGTRTCARCKARIDGDTPVSHHECSHDPGHRATLRLGSRLGWVRCPACEELIERHGGCAHMTCVCGAQFCYRCCAAWKTCNCVDWGDGEGADALEARMFAPLEEGGDLGDRLALWVPPLVERAANRSRGDSERLETQVEVGVRTDTPEAEVLPMPVVVQRARTRSRPRSCTLPPNEALRVLEDDVVGATALSATANLNAGPKVPQGIDVVDQRRAGEDEDESDTATCFPFSVDSHILARGLLAQESRRRRTGSSSVLL